MGEVGPKTPVKELRPKPLQPGPERLFSGALPLRPETLRDLKTDWARLAASAANPNPFYEPFFIAPMINIGPPGEIFTCYDDDSLIGLWPLQRERSAVSPWSHDYLYFPAPLIESGCEDRFAAAFLAWMDTQSAQTGHLKLSGFPATSDFFKALKQAAASQGNLFLPLGRFDRAYAIGHEEPDSYFNANLSRQRRKQLRAKKRKLGAHGEVTVEQLHDAKELNEWFDDFLRIEAAGWKGEAGTALSKKETHEQAFRKFTSAAFDQQQLQFTRLCTGGRPVAYAIDVLAGRGAFALKIAHDPAFHRYSPGVLLEADLLKRSLLNPEIDWVDSCASSSHSVLNSLWGETMPFTDVFISRSSIISKITTLTAAAEFITKARYASLTKRLNVKGFTKAKHKKAIEQTAA